MIKEQEIAAQNPVSRGKIQQIIDDKLAELGMKLNADDRQLLMDFLKKMRSLNINFDQVKSQLDNLSKTHSTTN